MMDRLLIIGAGPAGLAAAHAAAPSGMHIDIIDDNFQSGGQIWRGGFQQQADMRARTIWHELNQAQNVHFHFQTKLVHIEQRDQHVVATAEHAPQSTSLQFTANKVIIATGARELLLPFPGWTLPGVTGAGGLQALAKNGFPVKGKTVIVAGSGPLLLAAAATLTAYGAHVTHIIEQAPMSALRQFAFGLLKTPSKIKQALGLAWKLKQSHYCSDSFVLAAESIQEDQKRVRVSMQGKIVELACDYLACGFGLTPNLEIAAGLGCEIHHTSMNAHVIVNEWQETSVKQVYCAGESTGIGGVDLALAEGYVAGYAASQRIEHANPMLQQRSKWQQFAEHLAQHFALRPELRHLCESETIVCRCEDVRYGQLQPHNDWRGAKLHTRCGMGACQGRMCGNINRFLFSWERDLGRLPFQSTSIKHLMAIQHTEQSPTSEE
jgi:NADPH-dependent 2,4-dienoyl-CoA reductase/sulfur reductase-like enzyme